jgi:HD-GYP domain-containing protein (c-di-GMP phosphodiesterase class II)
MRVSQDMFDLALKLGANLAQADLLSRVSILHDIGKRFLPVEIWDIEGKPDEAVKAQRRRHTQLGVDYIDEVFGRDNHDPLLDLVRDLMAHHHEAVDGSGWLGLKGDQITPEARMLCICDAFDGYSTWRPHFGERDISPAGVLKRMSVEKAGQFDAEILKVFEKLKANHE